jgi:hypothetical protein
MSKNTDPVFTKSPVIGIAAISAANPNLDGTGTIVSVVDGLTDGVRIDQIEVKAEATTTLGMIRLFISLDSGGTWDLWREIPVTAITPSGSVESFSAMVDLTTVLNDPPLNLADATVALGASTEQAEVFNVFARGGSYAA